MNTPQFENEQDAWRWLSDQASYIAALREHGSADEVRRQTELYHVVATPWPVAAPRHSAWRDAFAVAVALALGLALGCALGGFAS